MKTYIFSFRLSLASHRCAQVLSPVLPSLSMSSVFVQQAPERRNRIPALTRLRLLLHDAGMYEYGIRTTHNLRSLRHRQRMPTVCSYAGLSILPRPVLTSIQHSCLLIVIGLLLKRISPLILKQ